MFFLWINLKTHSTQLKPDTLIQRKTCWGKLGKTKLKEEKEEEEEQGGVGAKPEEEKGGSWKTEFNWGRCP